MYRADTRPVTKERNLIMILIWHLIKFVLYLDFRKRLILLIEPFLKVHQATLPLAIGHDARDSIRVLAEY